MKINDYVFKYRVVKAYETKALEGHYESGVMLVARTPHVVCKDGFSMSVQANFSAYSNPRGVIYEGKYDSMEIGFPSAPESLIAEYAEDWEIEGDDDPRLCGTVYGYVPVEVIDAVIEKHGGINEEAAQIVLGEQWYEE